MRKVLIVDDDEALRRLMRLELSNDFEVIDTGKPEEGLALALESRPDVILLDLRMPKYSGYDLLQTFTSFARTQTIPVIVVSGESGGQTKEHCNQLGAVGYLEKPIDFDILRDLLNRTVVARRHIPRSEVRLRLHVSLKLTGTDPKENSFEETVITDDVSLNGFLCTGTTERAPTSVVKVYLISNGSNYVGKARIVHSSSKNASIWRHGCRFVEKSGPWILQ
jgi:DNA-binding response OmpR family regulator